MKKTTLKEAFNRIPGKLPQIIAGPCSAETEWQTLVTARALAADGIKYFRAGIWKPRTKPGSFEGVGTPGLRWMRKVADITGMTPTTEVATPVHVEQCLRHGITTLWIGARTTANPFAMQELAEALRGCDNVSVMVKNPLHPDLEAWIGAFERLAATGITDVAAIHRGFSAYGEAIYRNRPTWNIPIELRRRMPDLPIIIDPSHIAGKRALVAGLCQEALDMHFDGLMIETHVRPEFAWSDAAQQLTPLNLREMTDTLIVREAGCDYGTAGEKAQLDMLRREIDRTDDQIMNLMKQRMDIARKIGTYKAAHGLTAMQRDRYRQLLDSRIDQARQLGMNPETVKKVMQTLHEDSVCIQLSMYDNRSVPSSGGK